MTPTDLSRATNHVIRLTERTHSVKAEHLANHWETISSLAAVLASVHYADLERRTKIKITPKPPSEPEIYKPIPPDYEGLP
jgi:hypothetical protein